MQRTTPIVFGCFPRNPGDGMPRPAPHSVGGKPTQLSVADTAHIRNMHLLTCALQFDDVTPSTGPTVLLFRVADRRVYGCCVDGEWEESTAGFGGTANCKVFLLHPTLQVVDLVKSKGHPKIVYNLKSRGIAKGIGIAADMAKPSLWLEPGLDAAKVRFGPGVLPGLVDDAQVMAVEVWGCGDEVSDKVCARGGKGRGRG